MPGECGAEGRRQKAPSAECGMRNGGTWILESSIKGLGAGPCGCWGGTAKYAKAEGKSRLGFSPSPAPSNREGGRRPGEITARWEPRPTGWARLPLSPSNLRPNPTKSNQIRPKETVQPGSRRRQLNQNWRGRASTSVERVGCGEMLNG